MRLGTRTRIHFGFWNLASYSSELQHARIGKLYSETFNNAVVNAHDLAAKATTIPKFKNMPTVPSDLFKHAEILLEQC